MTILLASASPRRAELLTRVGLSFDVCPSEIDEEAIRAKDPADLVCALANAKAKAVQTTAGTEPLILAADTIVVQGTHVLGKPADEQSAFEMLSALSGRTHEVYTGVCLLRGTQCVTFYERSEVRFRSLSDADISAYVQTGEPMDKAGSYGIQGFGALLVESLVGDYFTVMGLPLCRLGQELRAFGVDLLGGNVSGTV